MSAAERQIEAQRIEDGGPAPEPPGMDSSELADCLGHAGYTEADIDYVMDRMQFDPSAIRELVEAAEEARDAMAIFTNRGARKLKATVAVKFADRLRAALAAVKGEK